MPGFHHVEVWVPDADRARDEWGWLLQRIGFTNYEEWGEGHSWIAGSAYLTLTESPYLSTPTHDRRAAGMNHLAFMGGPERAVDAIMAEAPAQGWTRLYHDRYPYAGGKQHYAGWLENSERFKAEIVAGPAEQPSRLTKTQRESTAVQLPLG